MANSNNLTVSSLVAFISLLLLFNVVVFLNDAAPAPAPAPSPIDVVSTICQKSENSSLCFRVLKSAGSTNPITLDYYTLNVTHKIAVDTRHLARQVAAATTNPLLKERYANCLEYSIDDTVRVMEEGKDQLANRSYIALGAYLSGIWADLGECLDDLKEPPSEPSSLSMKVKYLRDMVDIAASVNFLVSGDDF